MGDASPEEEVMYHDLARYTAEDAYKLLIGAKFLEQSDGAAFTKELAKLFKKEDGAVSIDQVLELAKRTLGAECKQCHTHNGGADPAAAGWFNEPGLGWCCPECKIPPHDSIDTITLTFGEVAENHVGMQKLGEIAAEGFEARQLRRMGEHLTLRGALCDVMYLNNFIDGCEGEDDADGAWVLVARGGVDALLGKGSADKLKAEQEVLPVDKKMWNKGKVRMFSAHCGCVSVSPSPSNQNTTVPRWLTGVTSRGQGNEQVGSV
eukprot:m.134291 g.134291  ORF g.134291 m.134291 type:complete len:263 (+) comp22528_c0_seq8:40-828(+)